MLDLGSTKPLAASPPAKKKTKAKWNGSADGDDAAELDQATPPPVRCALPFLHLEMPKFPIRNTCGIAMSPSNPAPPSGR